MFFNGHVKLLDSMEYIFGTWFNHLFKELQKMNELLVMLQTMPNMISSIKAKLENKDSELILLRDQVAKLGDQVTALTAQIQGPPPVDPALMTAAQDVTTQLSALAK